MLLETITPYFSSLWLFIPLFFFIVAISFRLLDNSSLLFLKKDIIVNSSNVSRKLIKDQIESSNDPVFIKKLRLALLFRNMHQSFILVSGISLLLILIIML